MITTPLKWSQGEIQGRSHVWPIGTWSQVCRTQVGGHVEACVQRYTPAQTSCWASVKDTSEEETCLHRARASHPPQEHQGSWCWRIVLTSTTSCPRTRSLRKENTTNHPHRHHPRWTGGGPRWTEGMLFRGSYKGAASLQASSPCLAMPQTPSGRLKTGRVTCRGHIGNDLPCPRPVLPTTWAHYGARLT